MKLMLRMVYDGVELMLEMMPMVILSEDQMF